MGENRRIARNTALLYARMLVLLAIGLVTTRVVLKALGETDYGIYNIIAGVVVCFSFINQSLMLATQRFLNYHLGRGETERVSGVFCMSMNAYLMLAVAVVILGETLGLWFVNSQLSIPAGRMAAANWVYQLTLLTFIINLLRIPYHASIIAQERMGFFAWISLLEAALKLGIIYLLFVSHTDRLILYAALYALSPIVINLVYRGYCRHRYPETTRYRVMWDAELFRGLFGFSGWSLFGSLTNLLSVQGINILLNIFFGVALNAAAGIATTVAGHIKQFVVNFQTAFEPQIVKRHAAGRDEDFRSLVMQASKLSYFLLYVIALPVILSTDSILSFWLTEVPPFTAVLCRLMLVYMFVEVISNPLWIAVHATGRIRGYELLMSGCFLVSIAAVYAGFKAGLSPAWGWGITILANAVTLVVRCIYLKVKLKFRISEFITGVLLPIVLVTAVSAPLCAWIATFLDEGLGKIALITAISLTVNLFAILSLGLSASQRASILTNLHR